MSGIATSLSRYTPIYNSPFSNSLNLGARFLLGGRIVTTATRTVREVTADSPRGVAQIFIWMVVGPTCHFSLPPLFFQSRADLVPSPQRSPSSSISLLRPPDLDSSRRNFPRHLLHLPQTLDRLLPGRNRPHYRRTPLEVLEVCSTVDPPLQSSSTRTDRGNEFVVSSLCFTAFFPFHGASPAQEHDRRRRRRPCCRLGRGSEISYRGRSAWEARTVRQSG